MKHQRTPDFDLLEEAWIPVSRASGVREWMAPWQITADHGDDPIEGVSSGRFDFDGALTEFLIGLFQTVCPPGSQEEWGEWLGEPPEPEELQARLEPWGGGFVLLGEGPRFMQDLEGVEGAKRYDAAQMLIEVPTGNTLKLNKDHFTKRSTRCALSPHAAAAALMTLQTWAPSGGSGHMTSIRGGGPLTTLLRGSTLWHTVWLNVLTLSNLHAPYDVDASTPTPSTTLPWTTRARVGKSTEPSDVTPLHALWGMPRRITLGGLRATHGECAVYGGHGPVIEEFWTKPRGNNYGSSWRHPLSPYIKNSKAEGYLCLHGSSQALGYKNWSGWALPNESSGVRVALPIELAGAAGARAQAIERSGITSPDMWVYGYDFDKSALRGWCEGEAPMVRTGSSEVRGALTSHVGDCVRLAEVVASTTRSQLRKALLGVATPLKSGALTWELRGEVSAGEFERVRIMFWEETEADFFALVEDLTLALSAPDPDRVVSIKEGWASLLCRTSLRLFEAAQPRRLEHDSNLKSRALAGGELARFVSPNAPRTRELLGLPARGEAEQT